MPPRRKYQPPQQRPDRLLRTYEVAALLRVSKRTVQRMVKRGKLPRPARLSDQLTVWPETVIQSAIRKLLAPCGARGAAG